MNYLNQFRKRSIIGVVDKAVFPLEHIFMESVERAVCGEKGPHDIDGCNII
ncbi:hypothetical protein [Orientia tsutsugamushi]|uniref:hypothetical protein n=1 Tax=Orientia tsutsugamushi TaxID=784 RepID=UPI0002DE6E5A|nr:hypothetical protein [Orientia tsutsugamushi]